MRQSPIEVFLDRLDPAWREDQLAFFRVLADAGPEAVAELAGRVQKVSCPLELKRLVVELAYYRPWPEWTPLVSRLLRHEKDLGIFDTGVQALGRIRTPEAMAALRELAMGRATPGFREAVHEALQRSDPAGAFQHHFTRLLLGSAQPGEANDGAHRLDGLITPDSLGALQPLLGHPDPLIYRHALRLLGRVDSEAAAEVLLDLLGQVHQDALEEREVRILLASWRGLPQVEVRGKAIQALADRWEAQRPEAIGELRSGETGRMQVACAGLREPSIGLLDTFLLDALVAAMEDKPTHLARFLGQAAETAAQHARRIDFAMDVVPRSLRDLAARGHLAPERAIPVLVESLRQNTAKAGVAEALAQWAPADAQDLLDLLLGQPEGTLRGAAVEGFGARKEPALGPVLLRARHDAITDIAERALWHLGQLPDPAGTARSFLASPEADEIGIGLRFIAMHHLEELVPDLLALLDRDTREPLLLALLHTLGAIGSAPTVDPLLERLHSGQPPRIQLGLAEALRDLGDVAGALALCDRAQELNAPQLLAVAVEALAQAHADPGRPLPAGAAAVLLHTVRGAWSDRNPWPLRRRIGSALLAIHGEDPGLWRELSDLLQATLSEKRAPGEVAPEVLAQLQTCARALAQRASA